MWTYNSVRCPKILWRVLCHKSLKRILKEVVKRNKEGCSSFSSLVLRRYLKTLYLWGLAWKRSMKNPWYGISHMRKKFSPDGRWNRKIFLEHQGRKSEGRGKIVMGRIKRRQWSLQRSYFSMGSSGEAWERKRQLGIGLGVRFRNKLLKNLLPMLAPNFIS